MTELKFSIEIQQNIGPKGERISQFKDKSYKNYPIRGTKKRMKSDEENLRFLATPLREIIYASLEF